MHIEHPVLDFENWKKAFDSDPVGRRKMGVRSYQILRAMDNPKYISIDLQLETAQQAETLLAALHSMWKQVDGKIIMNPQARIAEIIETVAVPI